MLQKDEIHFFNDIAYYHVPFTHCPTGEDMRLKLKCHCNPNDNFDWKGYSCKFFVLALDDTRINILYPGTSRFFDINKLEKPVGWEDQSG